MVHDLKTKPEYFRATLSGEKRFEFRLNDRNFALGDSICLREWIDSAQRYTGRTSTHRITYILCIAAFAYELEYFTLAALDRRWVVLGISEPKT
jgi:hypothetical protein